jgi:hypothetical protein
MSTNAKSLTLAVALVVALLGFVTYLVRFSGASEHHAPGVAGEHGEHAGAAETRHRVIRPEERGPAGREFYAQRLQARFTRKGQRVEVKAGGADNTVLEMVWDPRVRDREHIEQLKKAKPFHHELAGRGFRSLTLKLGPRVIWSTEL